MGNWPRRFCKEEDEELSFPLPLFLKVSFSISKGLVYVTPPSIGRGRNGKEGGERNDGFLPCHNEAISSLEKEGGIFLHQCHLLDHRLVDELRLWLDGLSCVALEEEVECQEEKVREYLGVQGSLASQAPSCHNPSLSFPLLFSHVKKLRLSGNHC